MTDKSESKGEDVNILDDLLGGNIEDLGCGDDNPIPKETDPRRSQRFTPTSSSEDGNPRRRENTARKRTSVPPRRSSATNPSRGGKKGVRIIPSAAALRSLQLHRKHPEAAGKIPESSSSKSKDDFDGDLIESDTCDSVAASSSTDRAVTGSKNEDKSPEVLDDSFEEEKNGSNVTDNGSSQKDDDRYDSDVSSSDDEQSIASNPSLSSASFKSDSDTESQDAAFKKDEPEASEQSLRQLKKQYSSRLSFILREARYFLMKSNNAENVDLSKTRGVWSTPPANETKINQALKEAHNVILIFSVKESGKFSGFARLAGESTRSASPVQWILPPGLTQRALGSTFQIDWISKNDVSFTRTQHLFNPWNDGKPVKIGRDGQEIEPHVASELCRLFPLDKSTDWENVIKRSKEAGKNISHPKVMAPMGSSGNYSASNSRGGRGFRDRREPRGRFQETQRSRPFGDFGRGGAVRRRYPEAAGGYGPNNAKRPRDHSFAGGSRDYYKGSYDNRQRGYMHQSQNQGFRQYREREYYQSHKNVTPLFPDFSVREYHNRPPPMAPLPYAPPPPFDHLPPLPRYYDGPPMPEFPSTSRPSGAGRDHRSSSPYENSMSDYLRRQRLENERSRRDRERERERDRDRDRDRNSKYHRR